MNIKVSQTRAKNIKRSVKEGLVFKNIARLIFSSQDTFDMEVLKAADKQRKLLTQLMNDLHHLDQEGYVIVQKKYANASNNN